MKTRVILSLVSVLLIAGGVLYAWPINELPPVQITMHKWPGYFHAFIAEEKGYFKEEGVNVNLQLVEGIGDSLKNFEENETVDAAFGLQSDAILLFAKGIPLKIVYISGFSNGGDVVISQPSIERVEDLRGKTISIEKLNSFNHIFIVKLLAMNGLTEADVKLVPFPASKVPELLSSGDIDAGQTWEPYQSQALAAGYQLLASTADVPGIVTDVLMFKSSFIEERPEDVKKVIRALFRALSFREENPAVAHAIMARATGVSAGSLRGTILGNIFPDLEHNKNSFNNTSDLTSLFSSGKIISDFFVDKGVINSPVNLEELHAQGVIQAL